VTTVAGRPLEGTGVQRRRPGRLDGNGSGSALSTLLHRPSHLALGVPLGHRSALVGHVLPPTDSELELREPILEVDAGRYERHALSSDLMRELLDLFAVQQQLAGTNRLVVETVAERLLRDVALHEPGLPRMARARGFDLHPGLDE